MSRDATLAEVRRILAEARVLTGSTYCLHPRDGGERFVLVSVSPDGTGGQIEVILTEPMTAVDCLAFLRTYVACLEFSAAWRAANCGGGDAILQ